MTLEPNEVDLLVSSSVVMAKLLCSEQKCILYQPLIASVTKNILVEQ